MGGWKVALWVVVVATTLYFLYLVRGILFPFLLGFLVAVLLEPVVLRLRKKGVPTKRAVGLVFTAFFGLVVAVLIWAVPVVGAQIVGFSNGATQLTRQFAAESYRSNYFVRWNPALRAKRGYEQNVVDSTLAQFRPTLERFGLPTTRTAITEQYLEPRRQDIAALVQGFFTNALGIIGAVGTQMLLLPLAPFVALLLLLDLDRLREKAPRWIPPRIRNSVMDVVGDVGDVFLNYLRGITISWVIFSTCMAILLSVMGAPYAILLALFFGVLYLIPFVGGFLNYVIAFFIIGLSGLTGNFMMSFGNSWTFALVVVCVMLAFTWSYDTFAHPNLVGSAVGLNPLLSVFVVLAGGALFGLVGMVVAFPIGGALKVILDRVMRVTAGGDAHSSTIPAVPLRHRRVSAD